MNKKKAKDYFNEAREKVLEDINIKKETLDKNINEEVRKAEGDGGEIAEQSVCLGVQRI